MSLLGPALLLGKTRRCARARGSRYKGKWMWGGGGDGRVDMKGGMGEEMMALGSLCLLYPR